MIDVPKTTYYLIFILLIFFSSCTSKPYVQRSGILNLEDKQSKFIVYKSNKNDVVENLGDTILKEFPNENTWIYIETVYKNSFLGKKVIYKNFVLVLDFDNKGILSKKTTYNQSDLKNLNFDLDTTVSSSINSNFTKNFFSKIRKRLNNVKSNDQK